MRLAHRPAPARARPVVFGEVLFDEFPAGVRVLGGAPFNVAWHLQGLGNNPLMISAVGDDPAGREIRDRMEGWGLDTAGLQGSPSKPTGRVVVTMDAGENQFDIPPDQAWDAIADGPAARASAESARLIYHGTLALRGDVSWRALRRLGRQGSPTFVDLNLRDPWVSPDRTRWCLSTARWLKLNGEELGRVTGRPVSTSDDCVRAARALASEHRIHRVIVTRGAEGAFCVLDDGALVETSSPRVEDLVDTVGAGDAFSAVVCQGILRGWDEQLTIDRAAAFAADICRVQGAITADPALYERHRQSWSIDDDREPALERHDTEGLYILSLSVHGLVRGTGIELGRDPDTGGQVAYVIDQARALAEHPQVARVDVVTRQIDDNRVDPSYARPFEPIAERAQIVRLPFGPSRYLRKERLWPYLDSLLDEVTRYIRRAGVLPDMVHGHYADAGYVGAQLAKLLGVPFFYTGHSLGRVKQRRLLAGGKDAAVLEERYHFRTRIEAEERALETASVVIASTHQEVQEQYQGYDHYEPDEMRVIPPGVDLGRFTPAPDDWPVPPIAAELRRFLRLPDRPMILALARPDERKNFDGLIEAFASSETLRTSVNLVLVAGNRDDIRDMPSNSRAVLTRILMLVDRHDLYGLVAYPKAHTAVDIPDLYRLAARSRGVFVNPAFTEPFGLTLLEAAACGVPLVATDDGGPREILDACRNGLLVDATDATSIAAGLERALSGTGQWDEWSHNGLQAVIEHYSWSSHATRYVSELQRTIGSARPSSTSMPSTRLPTIDRILVVDIDDTLTGDEAGLAALMEALAAAGPGVGFGINTGRTLERALAKIDELGIDTPDVLITGTGTQLHYGRRLMRDQSWEHQMHYRWDRTAVEAALADLEGFQLAPDEDQTPGRLRYILSEPGSIRLTTVRRQLRQRGLHATTILDHQVHLDVLPIRASPGLAIRFLGFKWDIPAERLLAAGDSGNDADMLLGETLGVVVGNHTPALERLRGRPRVYFARGHHAWGVLEGIAHYNFLGEIRPDPETHE